MEFSSGPSIDLKYLTQVEKFYTAFHKQNIAVDFVEPTGDLSKYAIVIAPTLYLVTDDTAANIKNFVNNGGTFITTYFTGYVNENDLVQLGGYPAKLRDVLGLWVEEIDGLTPEKTNSIEMTVSLNGFKNSYTSKSICDIINLEKAKALGVYGSDFYKNRAAFTVNSFGEGKAYYLATDTEESFIDDFISYLAKEYSLSCPLAAPAGVEITIREKEDQKYIFILNHNDYEITIPLTGKTYKNLINNSVIKQTLTLKSKDVALLNEK